MVLHIKRMMKARLRKMLGFVKDRVSIGRVRVHRKHGQVMEIQVAVICATGHDEAPARPELVDIILKADTGSRMRVSWCINLLMERLNKTKSWIVALKCLTLVHKALHHGGFIFHDQFSFHPNRGGKNYLNLSRFRDSSTPVAWEASSWIRWYASFLEALIEASRRLGRFLDSHSKLTPSQTISGMANEDLMKVIISLNGLLHEVCQCPFKTNGAASHRLIQDALRLVVADSISTQNELRVHLKEISERLKDLSTSNINELSRACEMLTMQSATLVHFTNLAFAMNLLPPHQSLEGIIFTDSELLKITTAMKASQASNVALATTKRDVSSALLLPIKLSPPANWKGAKFDQKRFVNGQILGP